MITVVNRHVYKGSATYIGRGTALGNKFSHIGYEGTIKVDSREEAIQKYAEWLKGELDNPASSAFSMFLSLAKRAVKGENIVLSCSCKPKACHGDVIVSALEKFLRNYPKWNFTRR